MTASCWGLRARSVRPCADIGIWPLMRTSPSWARVDGPLATYAGGFRVEMERLGYTPLPAATHVRLMAHLSRWLAHEGVEAPGLTPALGEAYFAERREAGYA